MLSDRVSDRVNAGDTLSDSACRNLSIECDSCIRCLIERLLHLLSDRVSPASAV